MEILQPDYVQFVQLDVDPAGQLLLHAQPVRLYQELHISYIQQEVLVFQLARIQQEELHNMETLSLVTAQLVILHVLVAMVEMLITVLPVYQINI